MSLLQYVAAALISIGSVLVLRAVWMADLELPSVEPRPKEAAPDVSDWREAA